MVLASAAAMAQQSAPETTLKPGSEVKPEAVNPGDDGTKKAAGEIDAAKDARQNIIRVMQDFRKAAAANDTETMAAALAELEKIQSDSPYLASMKLDLLVAKKDWPAATKVIEELPEGQARRMPVMMTASRIGSRPDGEYPAEFVKAVCKIFSSMLDDPKMPANPFGLVTLANLQWKSGDKEAALATAKKAAETAKNPPSGAAAATPAGMKMPVAAFEKFAKAVEEGKLPAPAEFSGWMREEMGAGAVPPGRGQPVPAKE